MMTSKFQQKSLTESSPVECKLRWGATTTSQDAKDETTTNEDFSYNKLDQMEGKSKSEPDKLFNTITIAFLSLSFTLAMIVDYLGIVLALVGATGSTLVSYILPGLIYLKLHPDSSSRSMVWVRLIIVLYCDKARFSLIVTIYYLQL